MTIEPMWIGITSILIALITCCYYDVKYRRIPQTLSAILVVINIPILYVVYSDMLRLVGLPYWFMACSLALTAFYYLLYHKGVFKGGDFKMLAIIAWFAPFVPDTPVGVMFQFKYVIYLAAMSMLWMLYVYLRNRKEGVKGSLFQRINNYPRGSPMMLPIAAAFIMAVILR